MNEKQTHRLKGKERTDRYGRRKHATASKRKTVRYRRRNERENK